MVYINQATGLPIPQVDDPGSQYAQNISTTLNGVCNLTHTGPQNNDGNQLNQNSLNFTGDVTVNSNNITNIRSTRMVNEGAVLSGVADLNCLYVNGGNLYYNNATGFPVQLTVGNSIDVTSQSFNTFTIFNLENANHVITNTEVFNMILTVTNNTTALITLPIATTIAAGRFYIVKTDANAETNAVTIQITGGSGNLIDGSSSPVVLSAPLQSVLIFTDGVNSFYTLPFDNNYLANGQQLTVDLASTILVKGGSNLTLNGSSNLTLSGSNLNVNALSTLTIDASSSIIDNGGARFNATLIAASAIITNLTMQASSTMAFGSNTTAATGTLQLLTGAAIDAHAANTVTVSATGAMIASQAGAIQTSAMGGIALGGGTADWLLFLNPRSRNLQVPIQAQKVASGWSVDDFLFNFVGPATTTPQYCLLPIVHNGATLSTVTLNFFVNSVHSAVPAVTPSIRVIRINPQSGTGHQDDLSSSAIQTGSWANVSAYNNGSSSQQIVYTANQNNVIDSTTYLYAVMLTDENGANSMPSNGFISFILGFTAIYNSQFST